MENLGKRVKTSSGPVLINQFNLPCGTNPLQIMLLYYKCQYFGDQDKKTCSKSTPSQTCPLLSDYRKPVHYGPTINKFEIRFCLFDSPLKMALLTPTHLPTHTNPALCVTSSSRTKFFIASLNPKRISTFIIGFFDISGQIRLQLTKNNATLIRLCDGSYFHASFYNPLLSQNARIATLTSLGLQALALTMTRAIKC